MNLQILGLQANAQHRTDDALGIWKAHGKGLSRTHENYDGWQIRKTRDGYYWQVYTPAGSLASTRCWGPLHIAKYEAAQLIAKAAQS